MGAVHQERGRGQAGGFFEELKTKQERTMQVIAVISRKGGVGKTTSTLNLAGALAKVGQRVLVVDMDPQASLSSSLLGAGQADRLPAEATVTAIFGEWAADPSRIIIPTGIENLSLLPGSEDLEPVNCVRCHANTGFALRDFLQDGFVQGNFDRVLIDGPPSLQGCSWASMQAADFVLMPLQADAYGSHSIRALNAFMERVRADGSPALRLLGYLRTVYRERVNLQISYSESFAKEFPGGLLKGFIPMATQFQEAVNNRKPISHYRPKCAAAKAVAAVVEEMETRMRPVAPAVHLHKEVA
jgi:chromosome partitioning protein